MAQNTNQMELDLSKKPTRAARFMDSMRKHGGISAFSPRFNGPVYEPKHDQIRLTGQILRVFKCIEDQKWCTLDEISAVTGDPAASVSAQLRHLRKERFGAWTIEKRHRGNLKSGLWEYRLGSL